MYQGDEVAHGSEERNFWLTNYSRNDLRGVTCSEDYSIHSTQCSASMSVRMHHLLESKRGSTRCKAMIG